MGTAFEVAMVLNLQPELDSSDAETLSYMTRSQDLSFGKEMDTSRLKCTS